ncbi:3-oxoacid CoA-transferase subunit B [Bacillus sp. B-jedd]|uniref:3-oxoacid CoA-transferase subunit B n=1 Tax=Bacillus sp. B-jedd TaxID=1476857 RepID=UPI0005157122|nr:3-oxoacid CoA-transferase subunit B [Bacillus sp. B-jedd]CEG27425.1 succinyl-CoA:3-ketoacid-coenzyme A transferase subunit B [Bacillus sp. B-jedd]
MSKSTLDREKIARRIAMEFKRGMVVNLGVGIPTLIPAYIEPGKGVYLHSENGLLGMGPPPPSEEIDMDCISASKHPVTLEPGAAIFSSSESFGMIRGGHIDVVVLGALQVSESGEIANWAVPGTDILGVGGAMDLVPGAKKIIVALTHTAKDGSSKLVRQLTYPSTGIQHAELIVTELGVFSTASGHLVLEELSADCSLEKIKALTEAEFKVAEPLKRW